MFPNLRQILRRLTHEKGFTSTVLTTLALCIGANVAIYAVVDAILVRPLPFHESERLVTALNAYPGAGVERSSASLPNYYDRREGIDAFESTSIYQNGTAIIGESGSPQRVERGRVSPEFFETLRVPIALGRAFNDDDMVYANAQRLIITHEFWQSQFNGDPDILHQDIVVDGLQNEVVGVLPPGFRFLDSKAKFFIPLASNLEDREPNRRHSNGVQMIARLKPGVSLARAQSEMDALNEKLLETDPFARVVKDAGFHTSVFFLRADTVREARPILLLLQAGALSLLLIGGVNLVNLLLVRANSRDKEYAVRQALGAGQGDLAKDTTLETTLLALAGGALGLVVGALGIRLLNALGSDQLPLGVNIVFDGRVAAISLCGAFAFGLFLALPIVLFNMRRDLSPALHSESRSGTASKAAQNARHIFIVLQVAIAFVLLSGAGLLGLSLKKTLETSPGFRAENVLTASITMPWKNYPDPEARQAFLERLLEALRSMPGATSAGLSGGLPFGNGINDNATTVEGYQPEEGESLRTHFTAFAMGEYWQSLAIPLLEGRYLEDADLRREQRVCLVDQAFAKRYWPGESSLGRRIASDVEVNEENAMTVVGVVGTVKQRDLTDTAPLGTIYTPYQLQPNSNAAIVIRSAVVPDALSRSLRALVLSIDPTLPVDEIKVMQERIDDSLVARRSPALLTGLFATVALLLAAIGTYGVLAYAVNQRRREIGVRMALGAQPGQVLRQFLGLGALLLSIGVALGVLGSWAAGRAMQSVLFDVTPFNPGIVALTAAIMALVVMFATLLPSQRAARLHPNVALRDD